MAFLTTAAILAALAAGAAGGAGGINTALKSGIKGPSKNTGWANWDPGTSSSELGQWFKSQYGDNDYLNSLSDAELGAILDQYYQKDSSFLGNDNYSFDYASAKQDLDNLISNYTASNAQLPDYNELYGQAQNAIRNENNAILGLYDKNLNAQTAAYQNDMFNLNNNYNDYARNILSNQYRTNQNTINALGSNMNAARQRALEAGASAGLQLANNVNTLLSAQNKQASTSLETSNQLAQQMLNQQNAAASLRGQYNNTLSQDTQNRANLMNGTAERTLGYANKMYDNAERQYSNAQDRADASNASLQGNTFYGSYSGYNSTKKQPTNSKGY